MDILKKKEESLPTGMKSVPISVQSALVHTLRRRQPRERLLKMLQHKKLHEYTNSSKAQAFSARPDSVFGLPQVTPVKIRFAAVTSASNTGTKKAVQSE